MSKIIETIIYSQFDMPAFLEQNIGSRLQKVYEGKYKSICPFPFHKDTKPSFSVDYKNGGWVWYCYGCACGGTCINFFQKYYGIEYAEALEKICEISGIETNLSSYLAAMSSTVNINQNKKEFEDLHIRLCIKCRNFLRDYPGLKENAKWAKDIFDRVNKVLESGKMEEMQELFKEVENHTN
jgi:DNA primase